MPTKHLLSKGRKQDNKTDEGISRNGPESAQATEKNPVWERTAWKVVTTSKRSWSTGIVQRRLPGRGDSSRAPQCGQAPTHCKFVSTLWWQGSGRTWAWAEQGASVGFFSPFPPPPPWSKLSSLLTRTSTKAFQPFSLLPLLLLYSPFCTQKSESKSKVNHIILLTCGFPWLLS